MMYNDITAERVHPSGGWRLSALRNGYLVTLLLIGYTKREALRIFHDEYGSEK